MTLREKQRLNRIIQANSDAYRRTRRDLVSHVMTGKTTEENLTWARNSLISSALLIAESCAALRDHGDEP